jgi:phosphatidylserine/phosphatidylglycerophosphate/cardiolipin synthase-like enzyme
MLTTQDERTIAALSAWPEIAAPVLECLSKLAVPRMFDEGMLCLAASLPGTQSIALEDLLRAMEGVGLVRAIADFRWERVAEQSTFGYLALLLAAVSYYRRSAHRDRTTAEVVVTRPGEPSALEVALIECGFATGLMEVTSEAFGDLATSATKSLTVMTPFLDAHGGRWLAQLLSRTKSNVKRTVILRHTANPTHHAYPVGIEALRSSLGGIQVDVLDYLIQKPAGGYETFHAKVILSDDSYAYVGSANMNRASLEYSMELGVLLRGDAARRISQIVDAIKMVAAKVQDPRAQRQTTPGAETNGR